MSSRWPNSPLMKYSQAKPGRVFVVRLEDGDVIHERIEELARKESIAAASVIVVGGIDEGSVLVVGPEHGRAHPVVPMTHTLDNVHEVAGTGTIFPNEKGDPVLHLHIACGRKTAALAGCVRKGVRVWHVLEVVVIELVGTSAVRRHDPATGFDLLTP
jgi:predicted DNA-binding protein with PD1-like motif